MATAEQLRKLGLLPKRLGSSQPLSDLEAPFNPQRQLPSGNATRVGRFVELRDGETIVQIIEEHRYSRLNGSQRFDVEDSTSGGVSITVLNAPTALRNHLLLRNASASGGPNIYVEFGGQASVNSILSIIPGNHAVFDDVVPQDVVYAIADGPNAVLIVASSSTPGQPIV